MRPRLDYSLYLVTDRPACKGRDLVEVVAAAVRGGVSVVQLREKDCETREFLDLARRVKALLDPLGVALIINDRLDVALACGAAGLHVGQKDMHPADVRRLAGPDLVLGLSVNTLEEAGAAEGLDLDYLGAGPIFPTATKADAGPAWGLAGLTGLRRSTPRTLVGIGGIGAANARDVTLAGADGLAVVSAICSAPDPEAAAREILAARRTGLATR